MPVRATLRAGTAEVAIRIQEAMDGLTSNDVRARLQDAVRDAMTHGSWGYYVDHTGDEESGDVYYSCGGDVMCAPYQMTKAGETAAKATINTDQAIEVVPRTIYEPEAEDADHYATMSEALVTTEKLYTELPLYERFISKAERDAADAEDFAGKGKSFPILKPEDVGAAAKSLGRAGSGNSSVSTIKSKIIAIAKRKGWTKYLPKAWQSGTDTKEAKTGGAKPGLTLIESSCAGFVGALPLVEARASYPILMITPGTGSSAHYPKEVLKAAAEKGVFKKGSFMYWNHPTAAQEAARPEGDLDNLAAITTSDGVYQENGPKGPGVYATAKPMADYAEKIETRAPHIGLSIRAGGTTTGRMVDGKPELASIDYMESVDYVTQPGRGGMALAESSKFAKLLESLNEGELSEMDNTTVTKLQETVTNQAALIERLTRRALRADAIELGAAFLRSTSLNESVKLHVIENVLGTVDAPRDIPMKEGAIDAARLTELFTAESKRVGQFAAQLTGAGNVYGMGNAPREATETADQIKAREAAEKRHEEEATLAFETLMGDKKLAEVAAKGRAA